MSVTKLFLLFSSILSLVLTTDKVNKKCRVLALEGGGDKGSYQAGAINGLVKNLPPEEVQWDVVTGVSVGAINAVAIGLHEKGKENEASEILLSQWRNLTASNIYQNWNWGPIEGLFYKSGLFDTSVGIKYFINQLSPYGNLKRDFIFGATNVQTGNFDTYTNVDINNTTDIAVALLSSAAFPVMFPFGRFKNNYYMDGGVKYNLDIPSGVQNCEDKGFSHEDIIVDIVLCSNATLQIDNPETLSPIGSYNRYSEISTFDKSMGIIEDVNFYMKNVTLRYLVAPTRILPSSIIPLNFNPAQIEVMILYGQEDAKSIIEQGEGVHASNVIKQRLNEKSARFSSRTFKAVKADKEVKADKKGNLKFLK